MKIEEFIAGKGDGEEIALEGISIPVMALKNMMNQGYIHIKPYRENGTFSLWGKNCSACLTEEGLRERAGTP